MIRRSIPVSRFESGLILAIKVSVLIPLLIFAGLPVVYNNLQLVDTIFLLEVGWRLFQGSIQTIDFNDFYGEFVGQYIDWAFGLFGVTIKALDYAVLMLFATAVIAAALVCFKRSGRLAFWVLIFLIAGLVLTRMPLEMGQSVSEIISGNSFVYNRFATALALVVIVFTLIQSPDVIWETVGAIVCGALLVFLALTKPTFVIFLPFALLALLVQLRLRAVLFCLIGIGAALLLIDPWAQKFLGSLHYAVARGDEVHGTSGLIKKGVRLLLAQPVALTISVVALILVMKDNFRPFISSAFAAALLMAGAVGMATTMGGEYVVGQQMLPFMAALPLVFFERARRMNAATSPQLKLLMLILAGSFTLPHLANTVAAGAEALRNRDLVLFDDGPLAGFVALDNKFPLRQLLLSGSGSIDQLAAEAATRLQAGEVRNEGIKYIMLADGIAALNRIPDITTLGVIANGEFAFDYAVGSPPVLHYPVWQGSVTSTPELAPDIPLTAEADLVLLMRYGLDDSGIRVKMAEAFVLCQQTNLWTIFARKSSEIQGCRD